MQHIYIYFIFFNLYFTFHIIGGLASLAALLYIILSLIHLYKYIFSIFIVSSMWDDHARILFGENSFIQNLSKVSDSSSDIGQLNSG